MVWYFIGVYIINKTLQGRLEIRNSHVEKLEEKFRISMRPCNISISLTLFFLTGFEWSVIKLGHPGTVQNVRSFLLIQSFFYKNFL